MIPGKNSRKTVLFLYWINKILFIGIKDRHYKHMETEHTYHAHCACHCVCFCWCFIASHHPSLLTDDGLSVVTRNVVESHSIPIEVVQDSNTKFISLSVIWLSPSSSEINQYNFNFIFVKATKKQFYMNFYIYRRATSMSVNVKVWVQSPKSKPIWALNSTNWTLDFELGTTILWATNFRTVAKSISQEP